MTEDGTFDTTIDTPDGTWVLGPNGETGLQQDGGVGLQLCSFRGALVVQGLPGDPHWYEWHEGKWRVCAAPPSIGAAVEHEDETWILGPHGETATQQDGGVGKQFCWTDETLYVQGYDDQWYVWRGTWALYGPEPPIPYPKSPSLPRLVPRGIFFALETGEYWSAIECTDFQLLQRFLAGEDITPVLVERRDLGFNLLRVLSMCTNMFHLYPQEIPDYFDRLVPFFDLCAVHGLYVEFTVFADATVVMPSASDQIVHWLAVGAAAAQVTNVILELGNELDQPVNVLACVHEVMPIAGVLCSHGSNGSQQVPVRPAWDYETSHWNDAPQWPRKSGHNSLEYSVGAGVELPASHVPCIANENTRPDKDGVLTKFEDAPAGCTLLCAGYCFHSTSGKFSTLFSPEDRPFAEASVAGARAVPLWCQDGPYKHRADLEETDGGVTGERVYQRGDDDRCIVRIRPCE